MTLVVGTIKSVIDEGSCIFVELTEVVGGTKRAFARADERTPSLSHKRRVAQQGCNMNVVGATENWDAFMQEQEGRLAKGMEVHCDTQDLKKAGDFLLIGRFILQT